MGNKIFDVQNVIFDILINFDCFCKEHKLTYYICGGTLLGAIRHKGFIPWDDDIDVSMPRPDYEKLVKEYIYELPSHLELQYHGNTDYYPLGFAKITNKNTTIVEKDGDFNYRIGGAYIDVFPIDGAGKNYNKAVRRRKHLQPMLALISLSAKRYMNKKRILWKDLIIKIASVMNTKKLQRLLDFILKYKKYKKSNYVAVYVGGYGIKEVMPRSIYGSPVSVIFNDYSFNAPEKYEEYLKLKYGDYMTLPPIEKRIQHNFVYVNSERPYKDFKMEEIKNEKI